MKQVGDVMPDLLLLRKIDCLEQDSNLRPSERQHEFDTC